MQTFILTLTALAVITLVSLNTCLNVFGMTIFGIIIGFSIYQLWVAYQCGFFSKGLVVTPEQLDRINRFNEFSRKYGYLSFRTNPAQFRGCCQIKREKGELCIRYEVLIDKESYYFVTKVNPVIMHRLLEIEFRKYPDFENIQLLLDAIEQCAYKSSPQTLKAYIDLCRSSELCTSEMNK